LPAVAQTTGTIRGHIKDGEGNALPGVTVTVTSLGRGISRSAISGETGSFALPALPVEVYLVDAVLGRDFEAGPTTITIDLQLFNIFNNDAHDSWQTLVVAPGDAYYPRAYVLPRRLGLRLGVRF